MLRIVKFYVKNGEISRPCVTHSIYVLTTVKAAWGTSLYQSELFQEYHIL